MIGCDQCCQQRIYQASIRFTPCHAWPLSHDPIHNNQCRPAVCLILSHSIAGHLCTQRVAEQLPPHDIGGLRASQLGGAGALGQGQQERGEEALVCVWCGLPVSVCHAGVALDRHQVPCPCTGQATIAPYAVVVSAVAAAGGEVTLEPPRGAPLPWRSL